MTEMNRFLVFLLILCAACDRSDNRAKKPQLDSTATTGYKVLSYNAEWHNELGNEGQFVLERNGVRITAFCSGQTCWRWIEAVGKSLEANNDVQSLITYKHPQCDKPPYLQSALEHYKRETGKDASRSDVCNQTLVVQSMLMKYPSTRNLECSTSSKARSF